MPKRFQIIPVQTFRPAANYDCAAVFHKGRRYNAVVATNQPDFQVKGLVFATKANGAEMLLSVGEYKVV